ADGRRSRCAAMRVANSSSTGAPVARYVTGSGKPPVSRSAISDLPERAPPSTSVITGAKLASPHVSSPSRRRPSVIVVNTGDGKGKSSSAFGVMGRGWARGWRVAVIQFIKADSWNTGEKKLADHLGVE